MSEIMERLRDYEVGYRPHAVGKVFAEAADHIEAQEARITELEKALGDIAEDLDDALTVLEWGDITRLRDRLTALSKPQTQ